VLLPIILVLVAGAWFLFELNPPGEPGKRVSVDIPRRTGNAAIGDLLENKSVIGSSQAFQIYVGVTRAGPFVPGHYTMRKKPRRPRRRRHPQVRAGEGAAVQARRAARLTLAAVADRVGMLQGHNRDTFLQVAQSGGVRSKYQPPEVTSLEGLLYPDTYFISKDETDQQILTRLVSAFDQKADTIGLSGANAAGMTAYQTVRGRVAHRAGGEARRGPPADLGRDPQPPCGGETAPDRCHRVLREGRVQRVPDRGRPRARFAVHTYKVAGLPPTPISSVTVKSLQAAQNPAPVPYLYYVLSDKNGKHKFATTQEEHNRNVEEARQKGLL